MRTEQSVQTAVCVWSLGLLLFLAVPANAQRVLSPQLVSEETVSAAQPCDVQAVLQDLSQADVVYLGETHDSAADHEAQLQIIQSLHEQNPRMAIALEMFQRPYQLVLNQYLAGEISAEELRQQSEFDQRWGFSWGYYEPILEFARANGLPVIALNTPTEITRRVADKGLGGLLESDRQWIPPESEIRTDNDQYRQMLQEVFAGVHHGHGNGGSFDNFFLAQVLWDETMAEGVADFVAENPDHQVVVLAGRGHIVYGYGIPDRVARRLAGAEFSQRSLLLHPPEDLVNEDSAEGVAIADYFWFLE
ncbi:ChaN family lipoprotein [Leptolyngbya sp. FACHB-671]|uniref:ChaN family lipoprotein n=1 Tax=Leptolyngbya sp. FACHB-671 TaxID=2692812 RepID=UPI001681F946|nr:ChaN family lipoprotein [Leptolyngbya sp. FACHB-671]MBD2072062.1 ChaN family lipoprotein [Leptolyngbya sp. FACHB-671]